MVCVLIGCQAASVGRKGNSFRQQIISLYEEQALDNLIRAYNYRPFVQLDYRDLFISRTDTLGGKSDFTYTDATDRITRFFGVGASGQRASQLSFHADPIANENEIYESYMAFAHNPELFRVTRSRPRCSTHVLRRCDGMHYWVPSSAAPAFWELVMSTSLMRAESVVPAAYQRRIVEVLDIRSGDEGSVNATLKLDAPVPRGSATAVAVLDDGRKVRLKLSAIEGQTTKEGAPISEGGLVDELAVNWIPEEDHLTALNLVGAQVNIYSDEFPPEAPPVDIVPQRIIDSLDKIRANQLLPPLP